MNIPVTLTMYRRRILPLDGRIPADHTYVLATDTEQNNVYKFTCYDHRDPLPQLPEDEDVVVNGIEDIQSEVEIPIFVATTGVISNNPAPTRPYRLTYNHRDDRYGMLYAVHGVCHQAANRCFLGTYTVANPSDILGGRITSFLFGLYGRYNLTRCIKRIVQMYIQDHGGIFGVSDTSPFGYSESTYEQRFINDIYKKLIKSAQTELVRELIKLDFNENISWQKACQARFYLFMEDSFIRTYNGSYEYASDAEIEKLYSIFNDFLDEKARIDETVLEKEDITPEYIAAFDSSLSFMLKEFNKTLGRARFIRLFNQEYDKDFTLIPKSFYPELFK